MQQKHKNSVAKKVVGKKIWYFRPKGVKKSTVCRAINTYGKQWRFSNTSKFTPSKGSTIGSRNFSSIELFSLNEDISKFEALGALDLFVIYKLMSRIFTKNTIKFDQRFDGIKRICTYKDPIVKINDEDCVDNYHYICLERKKDFEHVWVLHVVSGKYIQHNNLDNPYHLAVISKK